MAPRKQKENLVSLPSTARKLDLKKWVSVDKRKPRIGQYVFICDADWRGWADYEFAAVFDGNQFVESLFGPVMGVSYWRTMTPSEKKIIYDLR